MYMHQHYTDYLDATSNPFEGFDANIIMFLEQYKFEDYSYESLSGFLNAEYTEAKKAFEKEISYQDWVANNDEYVSTVSSYFIYKAWLARQASEESQGYVGLH